MELDKILEQYADRSEEFLAGIKEAWLLLTKTKALDTARTRLLKLLSIKSNILQVKPKFDQKEYNKQRHKPAYTQRKRIAKRQGH